MTRRLARLAWLLAPALAAVLLAAPAHAAAAVDYVALGDSYSSGVGAPGATGSCARSPRAYPRLWADRSDVASFRFVACGGATTDEVLSGQLSALTAGTDLVTVTIGGNDAGFAPAVASCVMGSDAACGTAIGVARRYMTRVLPGDLDATYAAIRARAPNATVVVLGYPRLFETTTTCGRGAMSPAKRRSLNAGADELATVISARARAAGFTYADVRDAFAGHGICGRTPWINNFSLLRVPASFHPTAAGYADGYLPALAAAVR